MALNTGMSPAAASAAPEAQRVDLWLWHARFFKTRSLAARMVEDGRVRVNGARVEKPSQRVRPGQVLTIVVPRQVLVVRISQIGARRGPPAEARSLYEPLDPVPGPC